MARSENRLGAWKNPAFMKFFVGIFLLMNTIFIGSFVIVKQIFMNPYFDKAAQFKISSDHIFYSLLREQNEWLFKIISLTCIADTVILGLLCLYLYHHIVGPLGRFQYYLEENADKESVPPLAFRKKDFFQNLANSFNVFIAQTHRLQKEEKDS